MVNEEIFGGLKSALDRGESLKRAMMTFFNAGYKREEIEEAARVLNSQPQIIATIPAIAKQTSVQKQSEPFSMDQPPEPNQLQQPVSVVKQKVSNYGGDSKDKQLIFILVAVLVFLFGVLISIFVFKDELINFFSSFFA